MWNISSWRDEFFKLDDRTFTNTYKCCPTTAYSQFQSFFLPGVSTLNMKSPQHIPYAPKHANTLTPMTITSLSTFTMLFYKLCCHVQVKKNMSSFGRCKWSFLAKTVPVVVLCFLSIMLWNVLAYLLLLVNPIRGVKAELQHVQTQVSHQDSHCRNHFPSCIFRCQLDKWRVCKAWSVALCDMFVPQLKN